MNTSVVGASILNIITESLYDKPIVVFREYVQNSADSFSTVESNKESLCNHIWLDEDNLCFLDNGSGINSEQFLIKMESIAFSSKQKITNIGYKGIGRLAGISYCSKLRFINIVNYKDNIFQEYTIDCEKFAEIRKRDNFNEMTFSELMQKIGSLNESPHNEKIVSIIGAKSECFKERNTGFIVVLENIKNVLKIAISNGKFVTELSWLLPVPFSTELFDESYKYSLLFKELNENVVLEENENIVVKSFKIYYNGTQIFRPITPNMTRTYVCKTNFDKYAIGVISFSNEKIELEKKNAFSGIRMYIDNMLLCDENELIPMLEQYNFITHGLYEMIQTVKGIGAMIYIVDKVNISANARRTFFETTDVDALNLLEIISEWINNIYTARYALSHYASALKKEETVENSLSDFRAKALNSLEVLASDEIQVNVKEAEKLHDFNDLSIVEQKRMIKSKLTKSINESIKQFLNQSNNFDLETCTEDFKTWYEANG